MGKTSEFRSIADPLLQKRDEAYLAHVNNRAKVTEDMKIYYGYEAMLAHVLENGEPKFDRTGVCTIGIHGYQTKFKLDNGFPLITTKKLYTKAIIYELLWFIQGNTNIRYLCQNGVRIWNEWPYEKFRNSSSYAGETIKEFEQKIITDEVFAERWGSLGPVYGEQWRDWRFVDENGNIQKLDQMSQLINLLNKQQESGVMNRRAIISSWNVPQIPKMALPPCHCLFQLHSQLMPLKERRSYWASMNDKDEVWAQNMTDDQLDEAGAPWLRLDLQLYQRSCDIFIGVPFNIASYSLLLMMLAQVTNMKPGTFIHDYGDLHIYSNHMEQVVTQLSREPYQFSTMKIKNRGQSIFDFDFNDFQLTDYKCHPKIEAEVAV